MTSLINLHLVTALTSSGEPKVLFSGESRRDAIAAYEKAAGNGKFLEVRRDRLGQHEARTFPARNASVRRERLAAEQAAAAEAARLADMAAEEAARGHASLAALELADIEGITLRGLKGSGPGGQIITADVTAAVAARQPAEPPAPAVKKSPGD